MKNQGYILFSYNKMGTMNVVYDCNNEFVTLYSRKMTL